MVAHAAVRGIEIEELESRLELYNYTDQRLWRGDLDVDNMGDAESVARAVARTMTQLEEWLREGR